MMVSSPLATPNASPPSSSPLHDTLVRELSSATLGYYALDADDRATLSGLFEDAMFSLADATDALASRMAERRALRGRLTRHGRTHPTCRPPDCWARSAMASRLSVLDREIRNRLTALRRAIP